MLVLCARCERHIKAQSIACPFCRGPAPRPPEARQKRVSRAVMVAGAGTLAAVASCSSAQPAYGCCCPPQPEVSITSPCGFESVTTTCAGTVMQSATVATVGPITAACSIDVKLGDGTSHTVPVTFGTVAPGGFCGSQTFQTVTSQNFVNLSSPTCVTLPPGRRLRRGRVGRRIAGLSHARVGARDLVFGAPRGVRRRLGAGGRGRRSRAGLGRARRRDHHAGKRLGRTGRQPSSDAGGDAGNDAGVMCPGADIVCGGKCVDTSTDTQNCGGCTKVCALPGDAGLLGGGTWTCDAGACGVHCPTGDAGTTTFCTDGCYDTTSNAAHCGSCTTTCSGKSCCSSSCVDTTTDNANCGACGKSCSGKTCCSSACVDTTTDSNNCGKCGNKCASGETCKGSVCCTSPPQGTCGQSLCTDTGFALTPGCDPSGCVSNVCSYDSYCCSFDWDSICEGEVATYCSPYKCGGGC